MGSPVTSVVVTPASRVLLPGATTSVSATVFTSGGPVSSPVLVWSSDAPGVLSVDAAGTVVAVGSAGSATITATVVDVDRLTLWTNPPWLTAAAALEDLRDSVAVAMSATAATLGVAADELDSSAPGWSNIDQGTLSDVRNPVLRGRTGFSMLARTVDLGARALAYMAGVPASDPERVEAELLVGFSLTLAADRLEDFVRGDGPAVGAAGMVHLYDEALSHLDVAVALAEAMGSELWTGRAYALRAGLRYRSARWKRVHEGGAGMRKPIADAQAAADAAVAITLLSAASGTDGRWLATYSAAVPNVVGGLMADGTLEVGAAYAAGATTRLAMEVADLTALGALAPLTITSEREMHLILAEHDLAVGDNAGFLMHVNTLRSRDGLAPVTSGGAAALPDLHEAWRTSMFLQGARLWEHWHGGSAPAEWLPGAELATSPGYLIPVASDGGSGAATILIGTPTGDEIVAAHQTGWPDEAALVVGERGGSTCLSDDHVEFSGATLLGDMTSACAGQHGRVAVFSAERALGLEFPTWTAGQDIVDVTGLPSPISVPVAVWVALDATDYQAVVDAYPSDAITTILEARESVSGVAVDDVALAVQRFRENRTGLTFVMDGGAPVFVDAATALAALKGPAAQTPPAMCESVDVMPRNPSYYTPGRLNVYYVKRLGNAVKGAHCRFDVGRPENVIYVSYDHRATSTLAHEFGHALGLAYPDGGHTAAGGIQGFGSDNIMAPTDPTTTVPRSTFSLGQAFRMSLEPSSWVNQAAGGPVRPASSGWPQLTCPCNPYDGFTCPVLSSPTPAPPGVSLGQSCLDQLRLVGYVPGMSADPVGLVSGRTERDEVCVRHVSAKNSRPPKDLPPQLGFPNLERPGSCESRVTVFTQLFGMFVSETPGWRHWIDLETASLPPPITVTVNVFSPGSFNAVVADHKAGVEDMLCVHGACGTSSPSPNRTGLRPLWNDVAGVDPAVVDASVTGIQSSCTGPPGTIPGQINVFYTAANPPWLQADEGFHCLDEPTQTALVLLSGAAPTRAGLAHQVGHVLGLSDFSGVPSGTPNVMQPRGAVAAPDQRTALTLGQVFRAHMHVTSWLAVAGIGAAATLGAIDCDVDWTTAPAAKRVCPAEEWHVP